MVPKKKLTAKSARILRDLAWKRGSNSPQRKLQDIMRYRARRAECGYSGESVSRLIVKEECRRRTRKVDFNVRRLRTFARCRQQPHDSTNYYELKSKARSRSKDPEANQAYKTRYKSIGALKNIPEGEILSSEEALVAMRMRKDMGRESGYLNGNVHPHVQVRKDVNGLVIVIADGHIKGRYKSYQEMMRNVDGDDIVRANNRLSIYKPRKKTGKSAELTAQEIPDDESEELPPAKKSELDRLLSMTTAPTPSLNETPLYIVGNFTGGCPSLD